MSGTMPVSTTTRAVLAMLIAVASFALMDAALKVLAPHYPAMQVAALRGWCSVPVILAWVLLSGGFGQVLRVRWSLHVLRGALGILMLASFAWALRSIPLAEAYAIFFVAPLLIAALAVPLLGERVSVHRWVAIGLGLIGVLVVLRPGAAGMWSWASFAALVAALCYALSAITARVLGRTDSSASMVFWLMAMVAVGATLLTGTAWTPVAAEHLWVLLAIAVTGSIGQYAVTEAFKIGQASLIAPLEYTALAWGAGLDWVLWRTLPDGWVWTGAAIVIASGLYLILGERHSEARRRRLAHEDVLPSSPG